MQNVFGNHPIHERYDLKGSWAGRKKVAKKSETGRVTSFQLSDENDEM